MPRGKQQEPVPPPGAFRSLSAQGMPANPKSPGVKAGDGPGSVPGQDPSSPLFLPCGVGLGSVRATSGSWGWGGPIPGCRGSRQLHPEPPTPSHSFPLSFFP